jgi:hypothetical protein
MRLLVCGCRWLADQELVELEIWDELDGYTGAHTLIQGGSDGADALARNVFVFDTFETWRADWQQHGKAAGPIRNQQMIDEGRPDRVLAFWDGKSRGTLDCITRAVAAGIPVRIVPVQKP